MSINISVSNTQELKSSRKYKMILLFILLLLTSSLGLLAQDIEMETISWNIQQKVDISSGNSESVSEKIISHGHNHIEWKDEKGIIKYDYFIRQVNGRWSDVSRSGSILYEVECGGKHGTVGFTRDGQLLIINLVLLDANGLPECFRLSASNFVAL